jgi:hypothetical protein
MLKHVEAEINVWFGIHGCSAQRSCIKSNVIEHVRGTCDVKNVKGYFGTNLFIGKFSFHFKTFCLQHLIFEIQTRTAAQYEVIYNRCRWRSRDILRATVRMRE